MNVEEPADLIFRPARQEDLDALVSLEKGCFQVPWSAASLASEFRAAREGGWPRVHVLLNKHEIIAYTVTALVLDELQLYRIGVDPSYRRQGLAKIMLSKLLAAAERVGAQTCTLEVREGNTAARKLYESLGFREVGRRRRYYQDNGEDAILLDWCKM